MDRRTYLGLTSSVAVTMAGCGSDESGSGESGRDDEGEEEASAAGEANTPPSDGEGTVDERESSVTESTTESDAESTAHPEIDEATAIHDDYETTEVRVRSPNGERLGAVTAAVADTAERRYRGLSDTASLPEDRGMLFVFDSVEDHTFVMREMDFGIDIVYANAERTITRIHHAPAPGPDEEGNDQEYPGRGQYVLEVGYNWTSDRGVSEGDVLEFTLEE